FIGNRNAVYRQYPSTHETKEGSVLKVQECPPKEPRYLQCQIYALLSGKRPLRIRRTFLRKKRHEVRVSIAAHSADSEVLSDVGPIVFPEEKLPPTDSGGHVLTI